jgi:hypothetical protein
MKALFVRPNRDTFGYKPIGISLLSAIAKDCGYETRLFDTTGIDLGGSTSKQLLEQAQVFKPVNYGSWDMTKKKVPVGKVARGLLNDFYPDVVLMNVLSDQWPVAKEITKEVHAFDKQIPVMWGGADPTVNPARAFSCGADYACIGEGLEAVRDFLEACKRGEDLQHILNIWTKDIRNLIRPLKKNLDDLPYVDWEIFDTRQFFKPYDGQVMFGGDHMTNWGCVNNCTYCINKHLHSLYPKYFMRRYSPGRMVDELAYLKRKYNLNFYKFHDEDFLMRSAASLQELAGLYKRYIGLPFAIEANPHSTSKEKVDILVDMGCSSVSFGIETGDQEYRESVLHRVDTEEEVIKAVHLMNEAGIRTSAFHMIGLPFETRARYMKTVELNRAAGVQAPHNGFFYPFEGTELRDVAIKEGFFDPANETFYSPDRPALKFMNLTEDELIAMRDLFVLRVKLPASYEPEIRKAEFDMDLRRKLIAEYERVVWGNS